MALAAARRNFRVGVRERPRVKEEWRRSGGGVEEWRNGRVKEQRGEFKKIYNNICS